MAQERQEASGGPGKGEREFIAVRELRTTPEEFVQFAGTLPKDRDFLSALQMCFREPLPANWSVLYHTMCSAAERYAIRRATAEIRDEREAAQELPLFSAAGADLTKRQ